MERSKKVFIFTFARSEYGLLRWTIKAFQDFGIGKLIVGGAHLSRFFGQTEREIMEDGLSIDYKIDFLIDSDTPVALSKSVGVATLSIAQIFSIEQPDAVIILGDRYELLSVLINTILHRIPVIHIAGGELTYGLIDEQIRHSTTKISHIHVVSTEKYAENVSKMGEEDWRIHVLGSPGIENIYRLDLLNKEELSKVLGINPKKPIILVTYHPVTLETKISTQDQIRNLLAALDRFKDYQIVFTSPGAESESSVIVEEIKKFISKRNDAYFFKSLGVKLYLSVMKNSDVVVGNSSSGIIEAPSLKVPTVNIGDRQMGRVAAESVIHCGYSTDEIIFSIEKALYDENFKKIVRNVKNPYDPYGDGNFSGRLLKIVENLTIDEKLLRKRLDFDVKKEEWNYFLKRRDK